MRLNKITSSSPFLRPAVSVSDAGPVREPEARALAVAVAGIVRRRGEHLVAVLGLGVGDGCNSEAAEENEGDERLHLEQRWELRIQINVRFHRLRDFDNINLTRRF